MDGELNGWHQNNSLNVQDEGRFKMVGPQVTQQRDEWRVRWLAQSNSPKGWSKGELNGRAQK